MSWCWNLNLAMLLLIALLLYFGGSLPWWSVQTSGLDTNLRGVSVKRIPGSKEHAIWASGSNGMVLLSVDEGKTWRQLTVPGGGDLDFRDVEAFDADVAFLMSSGEGEKSRIYKTVDGGKNWKLQYSDQRPGFFLDSLACDSAIHCFAISDPVDGKFLLLSTSDGEHWKEVARDKMPAALPQEGAFAASGTAIALCNGKIFFGTGGPIARIFRSKDDGPSWSVVNTPIVSGNPSSGLFSVACKSDGGLLVVGGDYKDPNRATQIAAYSKDSGETWQLSETQPGGYRSAVRSFSGTDFATVGPNGTDVSYDGGVHWQHTDEMNLTAMSFDGTLGWAVGPKGTIARFKYQ